MRNRRAISRPPSAGVRVEKEARRIAKEDYRDASPLQRDHLKEGGFLDDTSRYFEILEQIAGKGEASEFMGTFREAYREEIRRLTSKQGRITLEAAQRQKTAMARSLQKHMSEYSHQLAEQAVGFFKGVFPQADVDYMGQGSPGMWVEDIIVDFFTSSMKTKPQVVVKLTREGERTPVFEETFEARESYRDIFSYLRNMVEAYSEVL